MAESQSAVAVMPDSAQGSLSFNVGPEVSASTAPFVSAGTVPLSGDTAHLDRFLAEAANPLLGTPTSERPTTASDLGTRRALLFSAGQGSSTPVVDAVQGTPGQGAAGTSVAPSQVSYSSTECRQLLLEKEQKILQQESQLKSCLEKQQQMEQLLHQLQAQLQQNSAVHVQPSISVGRINPQPEVHASTPTTMEKPGMQGVQRFQPPAVTASVSAPISTVLPMCHVSLPQHIAASQHTAATTRVGNVPAISSLLSRSLPSVTAPIYPVSYAAVVQPTLIPPAVTQPVQHTAQPTVPPIGSTPMPFSNTPLPVSAALPVLSTVDLVSDQQSEIPSVTLQDMPASDFLQQFVQACRNPVVSKVSTSKVKFRMENTDRVKGVNLRKGERLSPALVLQWVATARVLDSAALKARSREPECPSEWATFFKFYVDHMEDGLHEVMMTKVSNGSITSVAAFWNAVFSELFPAALVKDAFEDALKDYPIWSEPLGLERWEKVTRLLVQYKESVAGNTGPTLELAVAEKLYQQLVRVVHQCTERPSQDLLRQLALYQVPLNLARAADRKPTAAEYDQTFRGFMLWLSDWLKLYSYEGTFGFPMASTAAGSLLKPEVKKHLRQMPTPSTPVKTDSTPRKPPFNKTKLAQLAPTGKLRTWTWRQRTCPDNAPREECATPASAEAQSKGCEYLGDWLDLQGLCTYCCKPGHVKSACSKHKANQAKWEASQKKAAEAVASQQQENC